jgi:hypothetical protein
MQPLTGVYTKYDPEYLKASGALDTLFAAVLHKDHPVPGRNAGNNKKSK